MSSQLREEIDRQLHELGCMAEFAAGLAGQLDGYRAPPGFFHIEIGAGDRLAFCCIDILRRIEALQDTLSASALEATEGVKGSCA